MHTAQAKKEVYDGFSPEIQGRFLFFPGLSVFPFSNFLNSLSVSAASILVRVQVQFCFVCTYGKGGTPTTEDCPHERCHRQVMLQIVGWPYPHEDAEHEGGILSRVGFT